MEVCVFCGQPFGTCSHMNRFGPVVVVMQQPADEKLSDEHVAELQHRAATRTHSRAADRAAKQESSDG